MPRIKNVPFRKLHAPGGSAATNKAAVMKKLAKAKALMAMNGGGGKGAVIHTGKLKVPFRPAASASSVALGKKGLIKQLKRRSGSFPP